MPIQPAIFETHEIRRVYDEPSETWWFSVVDIIQVLTQQHDYQTARKYWNKLKERLGKEGSQLVTRCHQLKMLAADGKQRPTDVATAETLLRLVQSVPRLPEFFRDEAELRALWSAPDTRAKLLQGLAEKGFGREQLGEMQKIIDAEKSDLFDVLAHVAYALAPLTRAERAATAKIIISTHFNSKQRVFLEFVLSHYVSVGVEELGQEKLTPLLRLKYRDSIADAVADLGKPDEIGKVFAGFQKYLYQQQAAA